MGHTSIATIAQNTHERVDAMFVWIYWHGGAKADELRWSMRSVLQNYQGNASIMLVGDPPPWYTGPVIKVNRVDQCKYRPYRDQLNKFRIICDSPLIPNTFIWMMDDIYFLKPVTYADLQQHLMIGSVPAVIRGNTTWLQHKRDTFAVLATHKKPQIDYCTHMPHIIEKDKFMHVWNKYGLDTNTLQWELLYGAEHFTNPVRANTKLFTRVQQRISTAPASMIINNSERGWTPPLQTFLFNTFTEKSPYESDTVATPRVNTVMHAPKTARTTIQRTRITKMRNKPIKTVIRRDHRQKALRIMRKPQFMHDGLNDMLAYLPNNLTMVEVGSYAGESAATFAKSGKFAAIHCVDIWRDILAAEQKFDAVAASFPIIHKHKGLSVSVANEFANESVDFVYVDAKHDYADVRADIVAWLPKIKKTGFMGGHDFTLSFTGVIRAVRELFKQPITVFQDDSWLVKL